MAGDCPHGAHLEASLKRCHHDTGTAELAATHERYLKIIGELKSDLEQMSSEVVQVQKDSCSHDKNIQNDGVDLATSLKELETQNDRLEQALKLETQAKDVACTELETHNNALKCQIEFLKHVVAEREQHIMHLTRSSQKPQLEPCRANAVEYPGQSSGICCSSKKRIAELEKRVETLSTELDKSQRQEHFLHSETRKLNEELNESKRKNGELVTQAHRLSGLLKSHECHRKELAKKHEAMEENFEGQTKKLRAANAQLGVLSERLQLMERSQKEHNMERNLLREEVLSLKEKEAIVMGKHQVMQEQLLKGEKELHTAHDVLKEQQIIMKSNEVAHSEELQRLKEDNFDFKRKLTTLIEDYKRLQEAYDNEREICKQSQKLIESYRKWRESQLKAEARIRETFQQYEDNILLLLRDKKELLDAHRVLRQDYSVLEAELDRLRQCSFSLSNPQVGHFLSERSIAERLEIIRQTKNRISEQTSALQEELPQSSSTTTTTTNEKSSEGPT